MTAHTFDTCPNCHGEGGFETGLCVQCVGYGKVDADDPMRVAINAGLMPEHWTQDDLAEYEKRVRERE